MTTPIQKPTTVNEFIDAAAEYLDRVGWNRDGNYENHHGQVCIYGATGAIYKRFSGVSTTLPDSPEAKEFRFLYYKADSHILDRIRSATGRGTVMWNDKVASSKEQVIAMMRSAKNEEDE